MEPQLCEQSRQLGAATAEHCFVELRKVLGDE
jgi:hypothetical protein